MNSTFKQMLRAEMDFNDIKVKELAAKAEISPRTLEGYLSARGSIPPADVAVKIAKVLNVSVEYLVTGNFSNIVKDTDQTELKLFHKYYKTFADFNSLPESIKISISNMISTTKKEMS